MLCFFEVFRTDARAVLENASKEATMYIAIVCLLRYVLSKAIRHVLNLLLLYHLTPQDEAQLKAKGKEISKREDGLKKLEDKSTADAEAIAAAQKHFHAVSAGLSSNADGEDKTLADQLMGNYFTNCILEQILHFILQRQYATVKWLQGKRGQKFD